MVLNNVAIRICLLNPAIENNNLSPSSNLGDLIIQEAILRELKDLFPFSEIINISTHIPMSQKHIRLLYTCSFIFVGGTNLLSSNMNDYKQWKISIFKAFQIRKAILLGVGWWQYEHTPNFYTKVLLKAALSNKYIHSVRDSYTKNKMISLGIKNIINTGCPTMWPLANINVNDIPHTQSNNVLLMLTDYNKNFKYDSRLIELLFSNYKQIFFWPQGREDMSYIHELNNSVIMLEHSLESLNKFLLSDINCDYIGTRLHGGIKCILTKKRSLILGIDNRAKEIAFDTGLTVIDRKDLNSINKWINNYTITKFKIDIDAINQWKSQFKLIKVKI